MCARCFAAQGPLLDALRTPARRWAVLRFLDGARLFFSGFGFLARHRSLWRYAVLPVVVNFALLLLIVVGGVWLLHGRVQGLFEEDVWWQRILEWALEVLAVLALLIVLFFTFTTVAYTVSAPFNEALSARVEAMVLGEPAPHRGEHRSRAGVLGRVVSPMWEAIKLMAVQLGVLAVLAVLLWGATLLGTLATAGVLCWFGALDALDGALERKGYRTAEKLRFGLRHKAACLGFGAASYFLLLVPVFNVLFIPIAVVGATLMYIGTPEK